MTDYGTIPKDAFLTPSEFTISIPEQEVAEFKQLLKLSKVGPKTFENLHEDPIKFGVSHKWLTETKDYWETQFDWRAVENHLNNYPHFTVAVKDDDETEFTIHFTGLFSQKSDAIPIVLLHGWPGSFLEFMGILAILRTRYSAEELPYHIIVPSLPGYAFSSGPPLDKDWATEDIARMMHKLAEGLGFGTGYVVQGGDLGSMVARVMAVKYDACKAMHLNVFIMASPPEDVPMDTVDQVEMQGLARGQTAMATGMAYAIVHATRPATISLVLSSSPLALLAWIGEKFLTWSDVDPSLDQILESVMLYWFTQTFPRSIYPYRQYMTPPGKLFHPDVEYYCKKPMGYSYFPLDIGPSPRSWAATTGNLVWYRQHQIGGHFAALEKPEELLQDVEDFVKQIWK